MLSSDSSGGPMACICFTQPSQMAYRRAKWASRSIAAGSQGSSFRSSALNGSLNVLQLPYRHAQAPSANSINPVLKPPRLLHQPRVLSKCHIWQILSA